MNDETAPADTATPSRGQPTPVNERKLGAPRADSETLVALIRDETQTAYRLAMSIVQDASLAEDVLQESFVKAWLALESWRGEAPLRHWLLRIVHNTAVSTVRAVRDVQTAPEVLDRHPASVDVARHVENLVAIERLWEALAEMDELTRAIVALREIEGFSYDEISAILDAPMPTVKTRLFRARHAISAAIEDG